MRRMRWYFVEEPVRSCRPLRAFLFLALASVAPAAASAQSLQPYISAEAGGWFGDGGTTAAIAAGFGVRTTRNIGFEIEVSYIPDLEFQDPQIPAIAIFPPIEFDATGSIVSLQTHVVGVLPASGTRLRAFVLGGGGVADVEQRTRISFGGFPFPLLGLTDIAFPFPIPIDTEDRQSDAVLVLSAGAGFDYPLTRRIGLGTSIRYQRLFTAPERTDGARVALRMTWQF